MLYSIPVHKLLIIVKIHKNYKNYDTLAKILFV